MKNHLIRSAKIHLSAVLLAMAVVAVSAILVVRLRNPMPNAQTDLTNSGQSASSSSRTGPRSPSANADNRQPESPAEPLAFPPTLKERRYDAAIRDVVVREDPVVDGWESEQFSELADKQLKRLGQLLSAPHTIDQANGELLCLPSFRGQTLRPERLQTAYKDPSFTVRRAALEQLPGMPHQGIAGLLDALRGQAKPFKSVEDVHFKFKIFRVNLRGRQAETTAYFQIAGVSASERIQVNATWTCTWELQRKSDAPRLIGISVSDYEEVTSPNRPGPLFADCTEAAFSGSTVLREQFVHGRDHWYGNLEGSIGVEGRGNGIAVGDVNGDGLEDIYLCQPAALPNRLFLRRADGSLEEVSATAGVDWLDSSRGALLVDLDNDGDQDLLLAQSSQVLFHENDGSGMFQVRWTMASEGRLFSMCADDFDRDGDLDVFVCGYSGAGQTRPEDIFASPMPYHDANNGGPNLLLRNDGGWVFRDVTGDVGLDANNSRFSLAAAWEDFDNDGDDDLYVANDFGRNNLYRNDEGQFVDIAAAAGVEDIGPGMSASWGDYNNDGLMDLYVSNMFSSAGSRITHDPQFKSETSEADLAGFQRHARGNSLFENMGDGTFQDRGVESGTTMGRWAWGSLFVDINNDGWQDVYVANGFVTADNNNDL